MSEPLSVVGQRVQRSDAVGKVTGATRYVDDIVLPGMLYGRLARSLEPHARVREVRTEAARALPGVMAVLSSRDTVEIGSLQTYDPACHDFERDPAFRHVPGDFRLLDDVIRYTGEPVAAVAAETDRAARQAAALVDVDYEPLAPVNDPEAALVDGAPLVHEGAAGNVAARATRHWGDVDAALRDVAAVVRRRFTTSRQKQAQLELTGCVVEPAGDGGLTIWSPLQAPHRARLTLAHIFGLDVNKVRVVNPAIGGAFGKGDALAGEPYAAALALATGRPVKLRFSRSEDFIGTEMRHPTVTEATAGFDASGRLVALRARTVVDAGAYLSHSPRIAVVLASQLCHLYGIPNVDIDVAVAFTNNPVSGAFRGYGAPQAAFVLEQLVDLGAQALGLDPLETRRAMLLIESDAAEQPENLGLLLECLETGRRRIGWDELRSAGRGDGETTRGVGMACVAWKSGLGDKPSAMDQSGASVHVNQDGTVNVATAAPDLGTGVKTTLAQICAEVLCVSLGKVTVSDTDTAVTPYESGAHASRSLYRAGRAVQMAALEARARILDYAGEVLEADAADLEWSDGRVSVRGTSSGISLKQLLHRALFSGKDFHGYGQAPATGAPTCAAQFAVVDVNRITGQVWVQRLVAVQEVGRAINPTVVEGQIEGGAHQGLGYALSEQLVLDESTGAALNGTFMDYRLLTVADGPLVESILLEHPDPTGPFGAKGVGEPSIILPAPAVANAISNATGGVAVTDLPMTAERVHRALQDHGMAVGPDGQ
jgi:xanthine dehydrogenase molybdenum-binding subunit